jgi:hypothetical protein
VWHRRLARLGPTEIGSKNQRSRRGSCHSSLGGLKQHTSAGLSTRPRPASLFKTIGIATCESSLWESDKPLCPAEISVVSGCVEKRRQEFAASRRCARKALPNPHLAASDFALFAP